MFSMYLSLYLSSITLLYNSHRLKSYSCCCHIDYCSQLWTPIETGEIEKIEKLQKDFFRNIFQLKEMNYWECLEYMKINSLQRRAERYRILYTWTILEGKVPNPGIKTIQGSEDTRLGRRFPVPKKTGKLRAQSFHENGPKLFNALPRNLRNITK